LKSYAADPITLTGLVQHYSPSGMEGKAAAWLVERMKTLGYTQGAIDPAGNVIGSLGEGPRQAVLLGHIDTVPGEIPVRVEQSILYGRGVVDAKGPLAAFVDAAARVGVQPGWQIVVIGAIDEERDSTGARYIASRYRPEFVLIGEPSQWERVAIGYKGIAWARVRVHRTQTHTASGHESACEAALACWERVRDWTDDFNHGRKRTFERVLPTLRGMSSGDDGLTEWAELRIGVRLPTSLHPDAWYAQLQTLVGEGSVARDSYAIKAYQTNKNTPLVRAFLAAIRANGGEPGFVLKTGTADLNIVAPAWGCPAVAYGPGDSNLDHTPNEQLSLEEYGLAVKVVAEVLERMTQPH
jgi:[amino group carrier protein]-lysine/ornithine hydrolase